MFIFTERCYAERGYATVSLSDRPSVRNDQVPCSNRFEFFENNFTAELVQREHPQNEHIEPVRSPKWCKIGPKLLLRTNRKSYRRFRLAPNLSTSMPLNG